jgi:hypothetical protein
MSTATPPTILAFEFTNKVKMNLAFARTSLFWEDPQHHGQSLTWSQLNQTHQKRSLPVMNYDGHNLGKSAYETSLQGLYPLSPEEKLINSRIKQSDATYILAYVKGQAVDCEHERYHALYDQNEDYQNQVSQIWTDAQKHYAKWVTTFTDWLKPTYHESVWATEFQAYLLTEPKNFNAPSELTKKLKCIAPALPSEKLIEKVCIN